MCRTTENSIITEIKSDGGGGTSVQTAMIVFCGVVTITSLATAIVFGEKLSERVAPITVPAPTVIVNTGGAEAIGPNTFTSRQPRAGVNECEDKKIQIDNVDCLIDALEKILPQAGGNVTMGFKGELNVGHEPIKTPYFQNDMCPVNVHWHLGTEHLSVGEYDEMGAGPHTQPGDMRRKLAGDEDVRGGFRCRHYDENDAKFTTEYDWQHCVGMEVGETYEVHWPHSAAGACGTINQYQTPFYDGVLCRVGILGDLSRLPEQVGVQAQVFTIVNDEDYFYPDLMRGMIVDGDMGTEITKYTGSTTGTSRDNEICSAYSPITWQVDRKCHMISASTFDKMCADMKSQRDDMSDDLYAHGSRELVDSKFVANNQHNRALRGN
ncbi:unnamed protein product [Cylindrotheca closterium]|uniref:Delta carbonic anhydrase n=1 Tax=Cylindrotheca closterium TaxID=2856 RepID=A0AAD2CPP0_9STRA|nr:unnamed protein product [Cylindrotheca closterium]